MEPYAATDRPLLPATLGEAAAALKGSAFFREAFGDRFVDWYVGLKEFEVARFVAAEPGWQDEPDMVTDWEHREYFTRY
jgi:glutamine synthetase